MTTARFTVPKQRLAQLLKLPGGLPVEEALAGAQANLAEIRPACMAELQEALNGAEAIFGRIGATYDEAPVVELYNAAVRSIGLGDVCGANRVDVALHSLCDLLDHFRTHQRYDAEAVGVHLRAWRLLINTDLPEEGAQAVLAGLHKVSAHYDMATSENG